MEHLYSQLFYHIPPKIATHQANILSRADLDAISTAMDDTDAVRTHCRLRTCTDKDAHDRAKEAVHHE